MFNTQVVATVAMFNTQNVATVENDEHNIAIISGLTTHNISNYH